MTRRPGLTLTEVLVTLAILAFGVLAILTLFPLAASQMAIAVREDRSAQAAAAADGYMRAYWKTEIVEKAGAGDQPIFGAFDNPNNFSGDTPRPFTAAAADEPSYPVMVDPMGHAARGVPFRSWIADVGGGNVARRTMQIVSNVNPPVLQPLFAQRLCSQMDGMSYDEHGHPQSLGGVSDRELRYNWFWLLQRPQNGNRYAATMTVVVFDNRPNLFAPNGAEAIFDASWTPGSTSVTVAGTPDVKAGSWVMDATVSTSGAGNKIRHANFYQVVNVIGNRLELQNPIRKPNDPNVTGAYAGKIVILRGVSGVYVRPPLTAE
jgi:prepilin-type N-terminal cleavage/methylation domain-containing protein